MFVILKDLLKRDKKFLFGFIVVCILVFLAILSIFSPYDPRSWSVVPKDRPPSFQYILGTNSMGQDIFWNTTHALKNSFVLGITTAVVATIIGTIVGLIAGYRGGTLDKVLMSINDSFIVLPSLPILVFLSFSLRGKMTMFVLGLTLSVFSWPWGGKQVRAQVLSLRERIYLHICFFGNEYVEGSFSRTLAFCYSVGYRKFYKYDTMGAGNGNYFVSAWLNKFGNSYNWNHNSLGYAISSHL